MSFTRPIIPKTFTAKPQNPFSTAGSSNNDEAKVVQFIITVHLPGGFQQEVVLTSDNQTIGETVKKAAQLKRLRELPVDYLVSTNLLTVEDTLQNRQNILIKTDAGVHRDIYINPSKLGGGV